MQTGPQPRLCQSLPPQLRNRLKGRVWRVDRPGDDCGEGDWLFYGHSNAAQTGFDLWWLIDLRAFRAALIRQLGNGFPIRSCEKANWDGTWFKWLDIRSFPKVPPLVVAGSGMQSFR